jgi:glucose/arabinose dehydrogenase
LNIAIYIFFFQLAFARSFAIDTSIQVDNFSYNLTTLTEVEGVPWGMELIAADKLLVTIKSGKLLLYNLVTKKSVSVSGLPKVEISGQGGLLDVKKSPDFNSTQYLYFTYAKKVAKGKTTVLARAKWVNQNLANWQDLLITQTNSDKGEHFGSRISFDQTGHVYFTVGDRGQRDLAQSLSHHNGKVIRLKLDGSVPLDNPFSKTKNALPEIWSYGHRNPQGIFFDQSKKELWVIEHGPKGGDEINLVKAGNNYGWPLVSFGREYWGPKIGQGSATAPGITAPIHYFVPSIAPSSLLIYSGKLIKEWSGNFLAGALVLTHLNKIEFSGAGENRELKKEERFFENLKERIRQVIEAEDGSLYLATDSGKILQFNRETKKP